MKLAVLFYLVVSGWLIPLAVLLLDRRRLSPEQRARSWNTATFGAAMYSVSFLAAIPWFWVTRVEWSRWRARGWVYAVARSLLVLLQGALAAGLIGAAWLGLGTALAAVLGIDLD